MPAAQTARRPHGRMVQCPGGYRAFVPAPLPPPIAWDADLASALSPIRRSADWRAQGAASPSRICSSSRCAVCYDKHMRLHITLDDELVAELNQRAGARRRSAFIGQLVRRALEDERRWDDIEAALGTIADSGHDWDDDPAAWVRSQRREDVRRSG